MFECQDSELCRAPGVDEVVSETRMVCANYETGTCCGNGSGMDGQNELFIGVMIQ